MSGARKEDRKIDIKVLTKVNISDYSSISPGGEVKDHELYGIFIELSPFSGNSYPYMYSREIKDYSYISFTRSRDMILLLNSTKNGYKITG